MHDLEKIKIQIMHFFFAWEREESKNKNCFKCKKINRNEILFMNIELNFPSKKSLNDRLNQRSRRKINKQK